MKTILFYISYLLIFIGSMFLVMYFTAINNMNQCITQKPIYEKPYNDEYNRYMARKYKNSPTIYDLRANTTFKKMFSDPDLILSYQTVDINSMDKLYI